MTKPKPVPIIDFQQGNGTIRRLNGGNLGPQISLEAIDPARTAARFAELEIPLVRLHDAPLGNPGMRLVDIQHIFGNWNADVNDPDSYYFIQTDDYLRSIRATGAEIFYRLGTSIEHSLNNYYAYPPQDYEKWSDICINIIRHYNEGWHNGFSWGIRYWEIWNEPDIVKSMWNSSMEEYCRLYEITARKIKARFPQVKVGGPALAIARPGVNDANMRLFLDYCRANRVPLDFFSWHRYTGGLEEIAAEPAAVRAVVDDYGFTEAELHLNEWHYWSGRFCAEAYTDRVDGLPGINAAVFATALLTAWQDTPLTMGHYYTIGNLSEAWGAWDRWGRAFKSFFTLKAFATIAHYRNRVLARSEDINLQLLAGVSDAGERAFLVSNFKTDAEQIEIRLKGCAGVRFSLVRIDFHCDWAEAECAVGPDEILCLPGTEPGKSSVLLLREITTK